MTRTLGRTVGVDLGQQSDYTAVVILDELEGDPVTGVPRPKPTYVVRWLRRRRGVQYNAVLDDLALMADWPALHRAPFVVDGTGLGRPIVDALRERIRGVHAVVITSGQAVTTAGPHESHVPKVDLVGAVQMLLQQRRLTVDTAVEDAAVLRDELLDFGYTITESGRTKMEATSGHDDALMALALACWRATHKGPGAAWMEAWERLSAEGQALPVHNPEGPRR